MPFIQVNFVEQIGNGSWVFFYALGFPPKRLRILRVKRLKPEGPEQDRKMNNLIENCLQNVLVDLLLPLRLCHKILNFLPN